MIFIKNLYFPPKKLCVWGVCPDCLWHLWYSHMLKQTKNLKKCIQFFQISAIFNKFLKILPQNTIKPQRPKCKHGSFCSIFYKLSELAAQGLHVADRLNFNVPIVTMVKSAVHYSLHVYKYVPTCNYHIRSYIYECLLPWNGINCISCFILYIYM